MGLFDKIKSMFVPSEEEVATTKEKLKFFLKQSLKDEKMDGYQIVYGKLSEQKDTLTTRKVQYFNYIIGFNKSTGELVILPVDPKLASCGWPIFVNETTLKSAKKVLFGTAYEFQMQDGDTILFEVPSQNYKIGKSLGAMELPIMQQEEADEFKRFFEMKYGNKSMY